MVGMSDVELLIILGFYYVGKEKNAEKFTNLFNSYFGKDLSMQTILHEVSIFKNVNPVNNVTASTDNARYKRIWQEYIEKEKVEELKTLYKCFMSGEFLTYFSSNVRKQMVFSDDNQDKEFIDEPKAIEINIDNINSKYKRDRLVIENALFAAGYKCEGNCGNVLFTRKDGKTNYTEAHHLIPLKFQPKFSYSLDVEANVVSLCPMCHRLLHHGLDNEKLLKILHDKRAERLKNCLIYISYEKLLLLYAGQELNEGV